MIVKYIVMECHEGYVVLMDEESRFVNAANLGYTVGQTVTDPVLMEYGDADVRRKRRIIMTVASAAACLAIAFGTGYHYYATNYKTYSTVIISSDAGVKMNLNKKGKVISLESTSPQGAEILNSYSGKGKDKKDAINDILQIGLSKGFFTNGETISLYISENYQSLRSELEKELNSLKFKADVQPLEDYTKPTETAPAAVPEQTTEPATEPTMSAVTQPSTAVPDATKPAVSPAPSEKTTSPAAIPPPPAQEDPTAPPLPSQPGSETDKPKATLPDTVQPPTAAVPPEKAPGRVKPEDSTAEEPTRPDIVLPHDKDSSDTGPRKNTDKLPQRPAGQHVTPKPAPHFLEPEPEPEPASEPELIARPEPEHKPVPDSEQEPEPEKVLP